MGKIDTSAAGNLATLAKLSIAFGVAGTAFVTKYKLDAYLGGVKLDAISYMLPIGAVFLCVSLLLSPATYKSMLPGINYWIQIGERIITAEPPRSRSPAIAKTKFYVQLLKLTKLVLLCLYPIFTLVLALAILIW